MASFTWRGGTYEYVSKPMLVEIMYVERKMGLEGENFTQTENLIVTWFISIRRGRPTTTWEEVVNSLQDEFQDVPEPLAMEPVAEVREEDLPLDPTDAGTRTDHPSGSGQHVASASLMSETPTF